MAWVATAIVGSAVIGGVFANKASGDAADASQRATDAGYAASMEQLDFEKEQFDWQKSEYSKEAGYTRGRREALDRRSDAQYARWESIYGPLVKNLGNFYKSLDSETFAAAGLTELAKSFKQSQQAVQTTLAQRGFAGGPLEASLMAQGELANAEQKAEIRRDAPLRVAQEQSNFLSTLGTPSQPGAPGLPGQPTGAGVSGAMGNVGNVLMSGGQNQANILQGQANSLWGSTGSLLSSGLNIWAKNQIPNAASGTVNSMATIPTANYSNMNDSLLTDL